MQPTVILKRRVRGLDSTALGNFAEKACRAAGLRGAVTILVTSSRELKALNSRFRGKPEPTDVLSFPPLATVEGFSGDIAISLDIAARNARMMRHSVAQEVRILLLHGILHLAGYDHESDDGEMKHKEWRLRKSLGLPTGLIERAMKLRPRAVRPRT